MKSYYKGILVGISIVLGSSHEREISPNPPTATKFSGSKIGGGTSPLTTTAPGENVNSINDLEQAFIRAKKSNSTYIISIKTDGYQWLEGSAFWESPTLTKPSTKENERALKEHLQGKSKQRQGV